MDVLLEDTDPEALRSQVQARTAHMHRSIPTGAQAMQNVARRLAARAQVHRPEFIPTEAGRIAAEREFKSEFKKIANAEDAEWALAVLGVQ